MSGFPWRSNFLQLTTRPTNERSVSLRNARICLVPERNNASKDSNLPNARWSPTALDHRGENYPRDFAGKARTPPPESMSRDEIKSRLAEALPQTWSRFMRLARPAIGLWPQRPKRDLSPTSSRLGGMPFAPPGWQWPIPENEPILFLGQINCADLRGFDGAERLPSSGMLAFFGDHDSVMGALLTGLGVAVYHWSSIEGLVPATPPIELMATFPLCTLAFRPLTELPDPFSTVFRKILPEGEQVSRYAAARDAIRFHGIPDDLRHTCGLGKLLGWPALVQGDDHDVPFLAGKPTSFRLLLQLDQYSNGDEHEGWGPGGSLYFLMRDRHLRQHRFERCEFGMQCT
jgi:hypothetical protein